MFGALSVLTKKSSRLVYNLFTLSMNTELDIGNDGGGTRGRGESQLFSLSFLGGKIEQHNEDNIADNMGTRTSLMDQAKKLHLTVLSMAYLH